MDITNKIEKYMSEEVTFGGREVSDKQVERVKKDWENYAKEKLEIDQLSGAIYAYGSELATLRLLKKYWGNKKVKQDYSTNKKTFFFRLEMR